jgi:hypothetical protein
MSLGSRDPFIKALRAYQPSNLLDKTALKDVSEPLTSYALDLVMRKWQETKKHGERIAEGEEEAVEFDREFGCQLAYEPPTRYGLPCRHWILAAFEPRCQLPLSLSSTQGGFSTAL